MTVNVQRLTMRSPGYPDQTPYWPCALFLHEQEIVAALFFDDGDDGLGHEVDGAGVVDLDAPIEGTGHTIGWCLHIIAHGAPSAEDPRVMAPEVEVFGDELSLPDALSEAYERIGEHAEPLGLTFEQSRERLLWRPVEGWPAT